MKYFHQKDVISVQKQEFIFFGAHYTIYIHVILLFFQNLIELIA